ncbi:VOC family protein [Polaromonas sp.]|uniref:VOC family protein n=1 Tax=Polaromonas sp. TaxID=1869339 RepID=UPI003C9280AB
MLKSAPLYSYVPASDMARARQFYEDKLALGRGRSSGPGLIFQCAGGTGFFLYPTSNAGTNEASCAFWQVGDIKATVAWLKGRGVEFEEYDTPDMKTEGSIFTGGGAMAAWFKDTEGNIMAVVQDLDE